MTDKETQDQSLEALFVAARAAPPQVPDALMARVAADARAQMPPQRGVAARAKRWIALLGGGPGVGGLIAATFVGFWMGLAAPEILPDVGGALVSTATGGTSTLVLADLYADDWIAGIEEGFEDE
ncbi:hypothetical protein [Sulfitobacter sp. JB4-11]|uniref:hypothetical protein n=1 Tax=Sulfitobacter rhodophyticola TaxID=3238304 RepID=UPI00351217F8